MKLLRNLGMLLCACVLFSCSDDDDDTNIDSPQFEMAAKVNGTSLSFQSAMPSVEPLQHPEADFAYVMGWKVHNGGAQRIEIYVNRDNLAPGIYEVNSQAALDADNFLYFRDNTNQQEENNLNGTLTITEVNTTTKIIKGTFEMETSDNPGAEDPVVNYQITEGTFNCAYDLN